MSSVVLQVGQCGNQVGEEFWKQVLKEKTATDSCVYAHRDGKFRSVHIDSEPKVIQRLVQEFDSSLFREGNVVSGKRGRGTNWAFGYHGSKFDQKDVLLEAALETLRKETERCDSYSGTILFHSMSGGTGSGLGSHLCEAIKDEFPVSYLMSCVVAPHSSGESPLQHYNSLLCLASLQRYTDAVLLFHNDEVLHRLEKRTRRKDQEVSVSFADMNRHIASCLSGVFLPVDSVTPTRGVSIGLEPWELLRSVCPMPAVKFLHVDHIAKSKVTWENLTGSLLQALPRYDRSGQTYSSLANLVVARGDKTGSFPAYMKQIEEKVKQAHNCVQWNPYPVDFWISKSNIGALRDSASVTNASNYSNITDYAEQLIVRAQEMYNVKAYLHWYWKYGCEQGDFEEAFETVSSIISNYKDHVS